MLKQQVAHHFSLAGIVCTACCLLRTSPKPCAACVGLQLTLGRWLANAGMLVVKRTCMSCMQTQHKCALAVLCACILCRMVAACFKRHMLLRFRRVKCDVAAALTWAHRGEGTTAIQIPMGGLGAAKTRGIHPAGQPANQPEAAKQSSSCASHAGV
jgi:hypothetical protein